MIPATRRFAALVLVLCAVPLAAQKKPDFSGRWVVLSPSKEKGTEQVVTLDDKSLTTEGQNGSHKIVYPLDGVEHRIPLPASVSKMVNSMMSSAKWDGDRIVILTNINYSAGNREQAKDVWSIDKQGRLVIDTVETGPDGSQRSSRRILTKKPLPGKHATGRD